MKFVIFHGAFGSPESNWFPDLKLQLEALNQEVIIPTFPVENWKDVTQKGETFEVKNQTIDNWFAEFEKLLPELKGEKLCFVGHSLAPLFILHVVEKYDLKLDSAIFVSPFMDKLNKVWQIDKVNEGFYKTDFNFTKLKKLIPVSYVLYSNDDPYVDINHSVLFGKALDSSMIFVKRAGHMNSEVNMNEFPLILELCKTRIDLTMYQKYMLHRADRDAIELFKSGKEGELILKPDEVDDEGLFHFNNIKNSGFATWDLDLSKFWNAANNYFENARKAARRIRSFKRVFIAHDKKDLESSMLKEFIKKDIEAGIEIYTCMYDDVKTITPNLDFGIWDEDYVCIVKNNKKEVEEIELNSSKEMLNKAKEWRKLILEKSTLYIN
jgi:predicted alpha/beta hydrolase family esterase